MVRDGKGGCYVEQTNDCSCWIFDEIPDYVAKLSLFSNIQIKNSWWMFRSKDGELISAGERSELSRYEDQRGGIWWSKPPKDHGVNER